MNTGIDQPRGNIVAIKLNVCINKRASGKPACGNRSSEALADQLENELAQAQIPVSINRVTCMNRCQDGPNMRIAPGGKFFRHVTSKDVTTIVDELQRVIKQQADEQHGDEQQPGDEYGQEKGEGDHNKNSKEEPVTVFHF